MWSYNGTMETRQKGGVSTGVLSSPTDPRFGLPPAQKRVLAASNVAPVHVELLRGRLGLDPVSVIGPQPLMPENLGPARLVRLEGAGRVPPRRQARRH